MVKPIIIAGRAVGPGQPCFVIAEAGVNHNGDVGQARRLIDVAVEAGADAVKFQTFRSEAVVSAAAPKAAYQRATTGAAESQLEMVRRLELPFEAFRELRAYAREAGIVFLSTPFDQESADFLASMDVPALKVASGEITNLPFLEHLARKGKPMLVSTGMSDLEEVRAAVEAIRAAGNAEIALLHCVSNYPAQAASSNLRAMETMRTKLGVPVGLSDHTLGIEVSLAAVALGACILEKHFTLDRDLPGPDHKASLEPGELKALVAGIRTVESALGDGIKQPVEEERETRAVARRSLVAARDLPAGTVLTEDAVAILRPGTGLPPSARASVLGKRVRRAVSAGTPITADLLQ